MTYKKKQWLDGLTIFASDLNRMEEAIERALDVQPGSVRLDGADIDDINVIKRVYNNHSTAFYRKAEHDHAPFEYGYIIVHDNPDSVFLMGDQYEQVGISLSEETAGKVYKRTIIPDFAATTDEANPVYKPAETEWEEAAYTKDEIDALFRSKSSYLGNVERLPKNASKGDICKVLTPCTNPTGKLKIRVTGITIQSNEYGYAVIDTGSDGPLYDFLINVYGCSNGYTSDGEGCFGYFENENGVLDLSVQNDGGYTFTIHNVTPEKLAEYLVNGHDVICYLGEMSELQNSLKEYEQIGEYQPGCFFIKGKGDRWSVLAEPSEPIYAALRTLHNKIAKLEEMKPMCFVAEVDALPETADEGEVYKASINEHKWTFKTDIFAYNAVININDSAIEGYYDDLSFYDAAELYNLTGIIKIETPTDNVIFDVAYTTTSYSPDTGPFFIMFGECISRTTDQMILSTVSECKLYTGENIKVLKPFVRHNGDWVEL